MLYGFDLSIRWECCKDGLPVEGFEQGGEVRGMLSVQILQEQNREFESMESGRGVGNGSEIVDYGKRT